MRLKHVYLVLCILGTVVPYSQFVPFVQENGLRLGLLVQQLFVNHVSAFFGLDVIISSAVVLVFIGVEGRRIGVSRLWLPRVAILTVGVSLALPLFLYMREVRQEASASR
jgi:uncharacterized protein DUF2834